MRYLLTLFVCLTFATGVTFAQDEKPETSQPEKESPYKTLKERASYTIGQNLAAQIKYEDQVELDFDAVIQGFTDLLKDREPKMTDLQKQEAIKELQLKFQADAAQRQKMVGLQNKKDGAEFLAKNGKREGVKTTDSGLQYEVLKEGKGKVNPKPTDTVTTHYHGTLIDGTVFDSSVNRGKPIDFPVNRVIPGWTEALQLMTVGDKFKLYVPADLAYADEPPPGSRIGPNATLIFEVELIAINGEKE